MKKTYLLSGLFILGMTACKSSKDTADDVNNEVIEERRSKRPEEGKTRDVAEVFSRMDENGDGKIAKEELKGPLANDFDKIDTNNDGFISLEELKAAPKPARRQKRN